MRKVSRRRFLSQVTAAGAVASPFLRAGDVHAQLPGPPSNMRVVGSGATPGQKTVLQFSDFAYRGMFKMPVAANGGTTRYGLGLTFRRVGGQKRLLSTSHFGSELYEASVPTESLEAPGPDATLVRNYGRLPDTAWQHGEVRGIHWDPIDQRLYQTMGPYYDPPLAQDWVGGKAVSRRTLYYVTLSEGEGTSGSLQRFGPWGLQNQSYKGAMGGITAIPQWFANAYTGGKRLALGFGGAYSTMGQFGPGSAGPVVTAVPAPNPASDAQFARLADIRLLAHDWNISEYSRPDRWHRSPDVDVRPPARPSSMWFDGGVWQTKNGIGYWTWVDLFESAGCWIDTPTKHGFLFAPVIATGTAWYESSDQHYTGLKHIWAMYDPMGFAEAAAGRRGVDQTQSAWQQDVRYPFNRYPLVPGAEASGTPYYQVPKGLTFDPVESRLYVLMAHPQYQPGRSGGYDDPVVYVYDVS